MPQKIVSHRKFQDNASLCPFCRAVWFQADYESLSAQSQRLVEEATNTLRANNFGFSLFVQEHPGETIPEPTRRDTNPVPPLERTRRPYTGPNRPHPPEARQSTASRNTQYRGNWRKERVYTYRELQAKIAAERAECQRASSRLSQHIEFGGRFTGKFPTNRQGTSNGANNT